MTLSEFEIRKCEKEVEAFMKVQRPPAHIRNELDLGYRIKDQSIEIFEIGPNWPDPAQKMETPVAKATFVKTQGCWKIFWQQADLKWHGYEPAPTVKALVEFLNIVAEDKHACFFG
ncbi:MAG: DUF3024 domain-containing protein [Pseudohongiellaceae bacterium]